MKTIEPTIYEAHDKSLPNLRVYLSKVWKQRYLIGAIAQAAIKGGHLDTWFGRLWTILNPLLLGLTYYLLIGIILGQDITIEYLAILLGGLFAFYYTRSSVGAGATSIVKGGAMVRATSIPRMILPMAAVAVALRTYIPTLGAYALFHIAGRLPITPALLMVPVIILIQTILNIGLALIFATLTVFFRDTSSFLPYMLRIWMYLTPVLYLYTAVPDRILPFMELNPLFRLFAAWQQILFEGTFPRWEYLAVASAWAVVYLLAGGYFFLSKEREFAIRI
jgi:ABC-type polysaccharide/polyol phosphate export permease